MKLGWAIRQESVGQRGSESDEIYCARHQCGPALRERDESTTTRELFGCEFTGHKS